MTCNYKLLFRKVITLLLFFLITQGNVLTAQNYPSDCLEAYHICKLGDYHFSNIKGAGLQESLGLEKSDILETNSIWLEFTVENGGEMEFVIVPEKQEDDIDFILYEGDECTNLIPLRTMTSGKVIGSANSESCLGQTGLRFRSDDIHESSGCFDYDDNFLKPIQLVNSKTYYLFINNFNSERGFNILFTGEEGLKFIDECKAEESSLLDFEIYPNPAINDITIKTKAKILNQVEIVIFTAAGRIIQKTVFENMIDDLTMDISTFPSGEYFLRIVSEDYIGLKSLVKI